MSAMKWLLRSAAEHSHSTESIGADAVFPILINVLCFSDIPSMHLIMVSIF
jgi:hypothetical protein